MQRAEFRPTISARFIGVRPASTLPSDPSMVITSPVLKVARADAHGAAAVIDANVAAAGYAGSFPCRSRNHRVWRGHGRRSGVTMPSAALHAVNVFRLVSIRTRRTCGLCLSAWLLQSERTRFRRRRRPARPQRGDTHRASVAAGSMVRMQAIDRAMRDRSATKQNRVLLGNQTFIGERDGDAQSGLCGALGRRGRQHP